MNPAFMASLESKSSLPGRFVIESVHGVREYEEVSRGVRHGVHSSLASLPGTHPQAEKSRDASAF